METPIPPFHIAWRSLSFVNPPTANPAPQFLLASLTRPQAKVCIALVMGEFRLSHCHCLHVSPHGSTFTCSVSLHPMSCTLLSLTRPREAVACFHTMSRGKVMRSRSGGTPSRDETGWLGDPGGRAENSVEMSIKIARPIWYVYASNTYAYAYACARIHVWIWFCQPRTHTICEMLWENAVSYWAAWAQLIAPLNHICNECTRIESKGRCENAKESGTRTCVPGSQTWESESQNSRNLWNRWIVERFNDSTIAYQIIQSLNDLIDWTIGRPKSSIVQRFAKWLIVFTIPLKRIV